MLLPIKPICEAKNIRRDGTSIIFIQYCYSSSKRTTLNTGIAIPPKFWVRKSLSISKELPASFGNPKLLNESLTKMIRSVEDLISLADANGIEDKTTFIKQKFTPNVIVSEIEVSATIQLFKNEQIHGGINIYHQLDQYIKSKEKKVSKATLTIFKNIKEHLQAFENYRKKPITFSSFDFAFYEDFVDFLTFDYVQPRRRVKTHGLRINSVGKTIKQLRTFILDRVKRKIIAPIDLSDFKIPTEDTDAIYLTHEEVAKLYFTDVSTLPYLKEYKDLFVLACLTGLRFSDFSTLRPEDLRNNMLYKKQEKTDSWVVIPMHKIAHIIFTDQFKDRIPELTNPEFNRHIKTIGKLAGLDTAITFRTKKGNKNIDITKPKYEWITTHTARRSFCSNELLKGTPVPLIMKISGHKKEASFYRYVRLTAEESARKVQEIWAARNDQSFFPIPKSA